MAERTTGSTNGAGPLLRVRDLVVDFETHGGTVHAVRGVSFDVHAGETLAVVGESGCGKSVTMQALMGLIPMPPGRITRGAATLDGDPMLGIDEASARRLRGARIGMIFQDPMTSLNPTMRIVDQIAETLILHRGQSVGAAREQSIALLDRMGIPSARERARQYPFEFSGGMLQRAMIAMAIACEPSVLVADEPTTALDVTIQEQILELLRDLQRESGMALILITHDLGVVARMADRVLVMYAGEIVERGDVDAVFYEAAHPYTVGLRHATPTLERDHKAPLEPIDGAPPDLFAPPPGCGYFERCPHAMTGCEDRRPPELTPRNSLTANTAQSGAGPATRAARCWLQLPDAPTVPGVNARTDPAGDPI